jgi:hypothetical protein
MIRPTAPEATAASSPNAVQSSGSKLKTWLLPLLGYLTLTLIFTYPVILNISAKVPAAGASGDVWQHLWNIFWVRFSLLDLHTHPFTTPLLFHPTGANLYFHALDPLDGYISVPLQLLFGLVTAYNLVYIYQITLAGFFAYLFIGYITGHRLAAFVAGFIYGFSPLVSALYNLGQMELTAVHWLPLYGLAFLKMLRREGNRWLWRGACVALLLALSLSTWYYALYALIFSGLYLLYHLATERPHWRSSILQFAGVLAVYGVLIAPVLLPTIREAGTGGTRQPVFTVIYNSTTIKGLFEPGHSALWNTLGIGGAGNPEARGNFLGYIVLILAGLGLATHFRKTWFWGIIGAIFLVLALGPRLHFSFDPNWTPQNIETGTIPLPGLLLYYLPFGNIARVPLRYTLVTSLMLAILVAYGLSWLATRLQNRKLSWAGVVVPLVAGTLIFLEFLPLPRPLVNATIPPYYAQIANEGNWNDWAILDTPDGDRASIISRAMYYQSAHGQPIIGGYLSRKPDYSFREFPGVRELLRLRNDLKGRDILDRAILKNTPGLLQFYKIRYVVVHPQLLTTEDERFDARDVLQTVFGAEAKPVHEDAQTQFWRVPDVIQPNETPSAAKVMPQLAGGWSDRLDSPTGPERRIESVARLALFNPYRQPLKLTLKMPVRAAAPTSLNILLAGQSQTEAQIGTNPGEISVTITLQPGLNDVTLRPGAPVWVGRLDFANA